VSWEDILKKKFKFSDIKFQEDQNRYYSRTEVAPDLILSVVAGEGNYSTPRSKLSNPLDYEEYEFAFWDKQNSEKWLTKELLGHYDDVVAYKTVAEIEDLVAEAVNTYNSQYRARMANITMKDTDEFSEDFSSKYAMETL
tara:strand:+ start:104 stop:523 length:420 start_codon:yes stop_codon:yes gene_type:complete